MPVHCFPIFTPVQGKYIPLRGLKQKTTAKKIFDDGLAFYRTAGKISVLTAGLPKKRAATPHRSLISIQKPGESWLRILLSVLAITIKNAHLGEIFRKKHALRGSNMVNHRKWISFGD
jgi:phosphotransferase system IIA component